MTRLAPSALIPAGFAAALLMTFTGTASAAGNGSGSLLAPPTYPSMLKLACREVATEQQATKLLMRLLPRAKLVSFEPLDLDGKLASCLLEVEMLADKDDPQSKGFVYVLPDGQHFLNGPLMNKRSALSTNTAVPPSVAEALEAQKAIVDKAIQQLSASTTPFEVEPEVRHEEQYLPQEPAVDEATKQKTTKADVDLRDSFLKDVSALPSIPTNTGEHEVYVMFDPQCAHCKRLYAIHDDIAKRYNLKFNWVPMFLNEQSWAMTTHLVKTYKADPNKGLFTLDQMLRTKWVAVDDAAAINSLTEADYMAIKPASLLFYERAKKDPRLGTPLVMFRDPKGEVHVISGVPLDMDWLPLANVDTKKPEA